MGRPGMSSRTLAAITHKGGWTGCLGKDEQIFIFSPPEVSSCPTFGAMGVHSFLPFLPVLLLLREHVTWTQSSSDVSSTPTGVTGPGHGADK